MRMEAVSIQEAPANAKSDIERMTINTADFDPKPDRLLLTALEVLGSVDDDEDEENDISAVMLPMLVVDSWP